MRKLVSFILITVFWCLPMQAQIVLTCCSNSPTCKNTASANPALVNTASGSDVTGTTFATLSSGSFVSTAGNCLVVGERHDTNTSDPTSVTKVGSGSFTHVISENGMDSSDAISIWIAPVTTGSGSEIVTVHYGAGNSAYIAVIVHQISGTSCTADATAVGVVTVAANSVTSGSFTTTTANQYAVAFGSINALAGEFTAGSGYTGQVTDASGVIFSEDQIFTSIQTGVTASMSLTNSGINRNWEEVVVTVK